MKRRGSGRVRLLAVAVLAVVIVGVIVARGGDKKPKTSSPTTQSTGTLPAAPAPAPAPPPSPPTDPAPSDAGSRVTLTRKMMGRARWPLTVDRAVVWCEGSGGVGSVYMRAGGTLYAVNGIARSTSPDLPGLERIWRRSPGGGRVDIWPIIEAGLKTCQ